MKDTPPAVERKFRRMLMKRSGEERLKMGCSMHATARALAVASLREKQRDRIASALRKFRRSKSETRAQVAERPAAYRTKRATKKRR